MSSVGELQVAVTADTRALATQVMTGATKAGERGADSLAGSMRKRLKTLAKTVVGPLTGAFAAIKVGTFFKDSILGAEAAITANNRLKETLKNAGDETGRYAERQQELAEKISLATGYHDEEIKAGQAILATFHEVSSSAGEVGGSFDRATQAGVDLAAAGFGSIEGNATQLGKALNDPISGMSALTRVGVSFTDEQKKMIERFVETNDVAAAQDVILDAVESQVEGTAVATADASDKMGVGWQNLKETLGEALLPTFEELVAYITENVLPKIEDLVGWVKDELIPQFKEWAGWISDNKGMLMGLVGTVIGAIGAFYLINGVIGAWRMFRTVLLLVRGGMLVATAAQWLLNAAMLANPVGLVVVAIAGLVAALVVLYNKNEDVRDFIDKAWAKIKDVVGSVIDFLVDLWDNHLKPAWDSLVSFVRDTLWPKVKQAFGWLQDRWDELVNAITDLWENTLKPAFTAVYEFARDDLWPILQKVFGWIGDAWDKLVEAVKWVWERILKPVFEAVFGFARDVVWPILQTVFSLIRAYWDIMVFALQWAWDNILKPVFRAVFSFLRDTVWPIVKKVFGWIGDRWDWLNEKVIKPGWDWVKRNVFDKFSPVLDGVKRVFSKAVGAIKGIWDGLKGAFSSVVDFVVNTVINRGIIRNVNKVLDFIGKDPIREISWGAPATNYRGGNPVWGAQGGDGPPLPNVGVGNPMDWFGSIGKFVWDFVQDPGKAIRNAISGLWNQVPDSGLVGMLKGAVEYLVGKAVEWGRSLVPGGEDGGRGARAPVGMVGAVLPRGSYVVTSPYGMRGRGFHGGIDLGAATGTPVGAAYPGTVSAATWHPSYGNYVMVQHPGGTATLYAHLSSIGTRVGQIVGPGMGIGRVGSTGNSTGPHLHFEYRVGGSRVNPAGLGLFDSGGILGHGGLALNMSGSPERVLSPAQTKALQTLQIPLANYGAADGTTVNVYIGSERLDSRIDYRVDRRTSAMAELAARSRREYAR